MPALWGWQGVRRPRAQAAMGSSLGIQTFRPYSQLGMSKLTWREVESWLAVPRSLAFLAFFLSFHPGPRPEKRRGAAPHSDCNSSLRCTHAESEATSCVAADSQRVGLPENDTLRRQLGRAPWRRFLPSCKLWSPVSCFRV